MADGKTHESDSTAVAVPLAVVIGAATGDVAQGLFAGFGCLCGIYLTPDLDVDTKTRSKAKAIRNIPFGLGWLWVWFWYPYAKAVKHRAWISHLPLVGTVIRLLYLFAIPIVTGVYLEQTGTPVVTTAVTFAPFWLPMFSSWVLGLAVSDLIHWVRDGAPIVAQTIEI